MLRPGCRALADRGITPNQLTLLACIISVVAGIALACTHTDSRSFLFLPAVLFIRVVLNAISNMLAREFAMKSKLGVILNELTDVISDAALYLPFALLPETLPFVVVLVVLLSALSELTGVVAQTIGASRRYDGPMGKSYRTLAFGILALLLGFEVPILPWLSMVWTALIGLLCLTIYRRANRALLEAGNF